jgi:adenosylcobinamide-GDP ribazoletransferase
MARRCSRGTLISGSLLAVLFSFAALRQSVIVPALFTLAVAALTARFYLRRIGGVTGDCFGATIQLAELAVYCCGAWAL